jgi:hypothetical protein
MTASSWSWLIRLVDPGQGRYVETVHRIGVDSWLPGWLIPFAVAGVVAMAFWSYRREPDLTRRRRLGLTFLRAVAWLAALAVLLLPRLEIEGEGAPPGTVPVIVDATESMTICDQDGKPRWEQALASARILADGNRHREDLRLAPYAAGREFRRLKAEAVPDGDLTSLPRMLDSAYRETLGEYCPGIVLLTDGADNSPEPLDPVLDLLRRRRIPVYVCGIGQETARDLAATDMLADDVVFINEKAKLFVILTQTGYVGQDAELKLTLGETEVYSGRHRLDADGEISLPIEYIPPTKGTYTLTATLTALPGEATLENNRYTKTVRVIDEKIRILMLFGMPSWEFRYLSGSFDRDERVALKTYLAEVDRRIFRRGTEQERFLPELPKTADELNANYDIVLISRTDVTTLPTSFQEALLEFVRDRGGAMVLLSDPGSVPFSLKGTPLEALLPVNLGDQPARTYKEELFSPITVPWRAALTEEGSGHQLMAFAGSREENRKIWAELPPLYFVYRPGRVKPGAITLMQLTPENGGDPVPGLAYQNFGKGLVLYLGADATWRWRKEFGDRYFRDFWGRAAQFLGLPHLLGEPAQSAILVSQENCVVGERIPIRAKLSNPGDFTPYMNEDGVDLTVLEQDVERSVRLLPIPDRPGLYRGAYLPESPGDLVLRLPEHFNAKPMDLRISRRQAEFRTPGMRRDGLEKIADVTGGTFFLPGQENELLAALWQGRPRQPAQLALTLWDSLPLALLALLLLVGEWLFRKLSHLD